jgi:hypothetical protein
MKLTKSLIALTSAVAISAAPVFAGSKTFKETVVVQEEVAPWSAALSTGYDSLYMFRGVNMLRNNATDDKGGNYGDGIFWTDVSATYNITENDSITAGAWMGWGAGDMGYQEFDGRLNYVHTIDDLALGLGYTFYAIYPNAAFDAYANELNASVAYNLDLGFMTLTPSTTYYFNLGPDSDAGDNPTGAAVCGSSYLDLRLSGAIPVIGDSVSINPWTAFGLNFGSNLEGPNAQPFDGANNLEFGVAVPWKINKIITLSAYCAYSIAFNDLSGYGAGPNGTVGTTQPNTFWGGGKVTFAF